ncbi:MAG: radical SAM family heme chaperone HemW [Arcicella sp.]|nr:radical SAM family heme chaperone HemW [Arcicella sp.]
MHLYLHIPFCRQACHYCDFHFSTSLKAKAEIVQAICHEITLQKDYLQNKNLETIYFGGGTPSLLEEEDFALIFETISKHFTLRPDIEITLEANPDDLTKEKLQLFKKSNINRLSIGIQSFHEPHLKSLNRIHTSQEAETCVKTSQDAGIDNITIDLIYAIPADNHDILRLDLQKATDLNLKHISAYCLTIEPKTVFGKWLKQGKIQTIDDEFSATQFDMLVNHLTQSGFEQYEICSFAKNESHSRHNTSYWQQKQYLGIGPSAHSFNQNSRQYNVPNNAKYVKALQQNIVPAEIEVLTFEDQVNEYLLTGLRTKWGCNIHKINELSNNLFQKQNAFELEKQIREGFLMIENDTFLLTYKGKLFADRIASDLFL